MSMVAICTDCKGSQKFVIFHFQFQYTLLQDKKPLHNPTHYITVELFKVKSKLEKE